MISLVKTDVSKPNATILLNLYDKKTVRKCEKKLETLKC